MNEYRCLGAELRCDSGRYGIVCHTEEAKRAYKSASGEYQPVNNGQKPSEYYFLGAELRVKRLGDKEEYHIVCHSKEAEQAYNECIKYEENINPTNSIQSQNLFLQVINHILLGRNKAHLRKKSWNEYIGCYNANTMCCKECKAKGLADRDRGCIFNEEGANSYDTDRGS